MATYKITYLENESYSTRKFTYVDNASDQYDAVEIAYNMGKLLDTSKITNVDFVCE